MRYEFAVLAALTQLDAPTRPKIIEATGISAQRITKAIQQVREIADIDVRWEGSKKTGHYVIWDWGDFADSIQLKHKLCALDLTKYKSNKAFYYDTAILHKLEKNALTWENYKRSLSLEKLTSSNHLPYPASSKERTLARNKLKAKYSSLAQS